MKTQDILHNTQQQILSRYQVDLSVLLPSPGDRIFEEQWIKAHARSDERHVAKLLHEHIHTSLSPSKMISTEPTQRECVIRTATWRAVLLVSTLGEFDWRKLGHMTDEKVHQDVFTVL